ncbi:MAG: PilW family protein [Steroidobacteraceae bacterium]|jgi:type IV pilus assembly protein PilW
MKRIALSRGFSLIELMIAVVLAVFLIGGLLTLVQTMKQTTGVQNGLSQLQDGERFASDLLNDVIQSAGDYPNATIGGAAASFPAINVAVPATGSTLVFAQGQVISGADTATSAGSLIGVRYITSGTAAAYPDGLISCAGNTSAAPVTWINVFYVDGSGNLQCQLTTIDAGGNQTVTVTPLVYGIAGLQILYGERTNTDSPTMSVDSYLTATATSALPIVANSSWQPGWGQVRSVQVTFTFTNPLANLPGQVAVPTINLMRVYDVMNQVGEGQT